MQAEIISSQAMDNAVEKAKGQTISHALILTGDVGEDAPTIYSYTDVQRIVNALDAEMAAFFNAHVRISHMPIPARGLGVGLNPPSSSMDTRLGVSPYHVDFVAKADSSVIVTVFRGADSQASANLAVEYISAPAKPTDSTTADEHSNLTAGQQRFIARLLARTVVTESGASHPANLTRVVWHAAEPHGWMVTLGHRDESTGWFYISEYLGGGRATASAVERAFSNPDIESDSYQQMVATAKDCLAGIRSPFEFRGGSNSILLAFDGTGNHVESQDNIARIYNAFKGTKLYYGGVGNPIDWPAWYGGTAIGFAEIIRRATIDLKMLNLVGKDIYVVGFSRGAAAAVEFARKHPEVNFHFVGLYDPVYSIALPGQQSRIVYQTWRGYNDNFVTTSLPTNIRKATAVYAAHEVRAWFPATVFNVTGATRLTNWISPGQHGEAGGHWQNNWRIGETTLSLLASEMTTQGAKLAMSALFHSSEIKAALESRYLLSIVEKGDENYPDHWDSPRWLLRGQDRYWGIIDREEMSYFIEVSLPKSHDWAPWGMGLQRTDTLDIVGQVTGRLPIMYLLAGAPTFTTHFPRKLWSRSTGTVNQYFTVENHEFFQYLFKLVPQKDGTKGWGDWGGWVDPNMSLHGFR